MRAAGDPSDYQVDPFGAYLTMPRPGVLGVLAIELEPRVPGIYINAVAFPTPPPWNPMSDPCAGHEYVNDHQSML